MDRDWTAEWATVDAEFYAAKQARDAAHKPVSPELGNTGKTISADDLMVFAEASKRFEAAAARRRDFMAERRAHDPEWNGST